MNVLTKQDLYTYVTGLLNGVMMDQTLFDSFLDTAQMNVEGERQWIALRGLDSSLTFSPGDTFLTAKNLPSDFKEWFAQGTQQAPIIGTTAGYAQIIPFFEIPAESKFLYKDYSQRFYCDYSTQKIYFCGSIPQALTMNMSYIKALPLISTSDSSTWATPFQKYTKILGLLVAVYWKLGVDYDIISNQQASNQAAQAAKILDSMEKWDGRLQQSMISGLDPFGALNTNAWQAGQMPSM